MTKTDKPKLATTNMIDVTVRFAHIGGVLAARRITMRKMAPFVDLPYTAFRNWLQLSMPNRKRARHIQEDVEEKLGIVIIESPYTENI